VSRRYVIQPRNQHEKDFLGILENIKPSKNSYEVFNDWLIMSSISLYNVYAKDPALEENYLEIANQYKKEEVDKLCKLSAITIEALEKTGQDFLGEIFSIIEMNNKRTGQYFTPYNVSLMMGKMMVGDSEPPKTHVCKISDPCCGAGGMLIAAAMAMKERGLNFQDVLFVGEDIDARCARMAFIQLYLLGVPALIICGNSLTFETYWEMKTIGYYLADMDIRLRAERMLEIIKGLGSEPAEAQEEKPSAEIVIPQKELAQGELF